MKNEEKQAKKVVVPTLRAFLHVEAIEDPPPVLFVLAKVSTGIVDGLPNVDARLVKYVLKDGDQA